MKRPRTIGKCYETILSERVVDVRSTSTVTRLISARTLFAIPVASKPTSASCSFRVAWAISRSGMPSRVIVLGRQVVGDRVLDDRGAEAVLQRVVFDREHRVAAA